MHPSAAELPLDRPLPAPRPRRRLSSKIARRWAAFPTQARSLIVDRPGDRSARILGSRSITVAAATAQRLPRAANRAAAPHRRLRRPRRLLLAARPAGRWRRQRPCLAGHPPRRRRSVRLGGFTADPTHGEQQLASGLLRRPRHRRRSLSGSLVRRLDPLSAGCWSATSRPPSACAPTRRCARYAGSSAPFATTSARTPTRVSALEWSTASALTASSFPAGTRTTRACSSWCGRSGRLASRSACCRGRSTCSTRPPATPARSAECR